MPRQFKVVVTGEDGEVKQYQLKQWLRDHPEEIPAGLDASDSTSHRLRDGLRKQGWRVEERETEVLLFKDGSVPASESVGESEEEASDTGPDAAFGLEWQLRDFLAQNIGTLVVNGKKLKLFVDPTGRDGVEYPSTVGPIDLLAMDELENFYVFELKRARVADRAMGQLARYMGWVKQTIGRTREVHGVIVAKQISDSLRYAASIVPNVSLFEYEVEFHLHSAGGLPPSPRD